MDDEALVDLGLSKKAEPASEFGIRNEDRLTAVAAMVDRQRTRGFPIDSRLVGRSKEEAEIAPETVGGRPIDSRRPSFQLRWKSGQSLACTIENLADKDRSIAFEDCRAGVGHEQQFCSLGANRQSQQARPGIKPMSVRSAAKSYGVGAEHSITRTTVKAPTFSVRSLTTSVPDWTQQ